MVGTDNLQTTNNFQTSTVEALTSGYRINNSGDDPAGLAVANQYRDNISELTQGVINANNGVSTLQIMDGGLNNISTMLDRL
jgi:flagellin